MKCAPLALALLVLPPPPSSEGPELGWWEVRGRGGRDWEGTLVLERMGEVCAGHVEWRAASGPHARGRESLEGTFDARTRTLALRGRELVDAAGNIVRAEYRARVAESGRALVEGRWSGEGVIPGEWSAAWKAPPAQGDEVARTPHFAFHDHELLNLHHFLYQSAKAFARRDGERVTGRPVAVVELDAVDALEGEEREAWFGALELYRREAIGRDLLFDGDLYELKRQLASIEDVDGPWPAELDPGFARALRDALPVYRARFWQAHDAANRAWVDAAVRGLERYERALVGRMTTAYGGSWPEPLVRVDVCAYANWAGAYTTGGPAHVTLASTDPEAQGDAALETLVHEASHTREMIGPLREELATAYAARGAEPPRDLWHLFVFVTAGEAVRRALADDGVEGYEHYGDRAGVYARGPWAEQRALLAEPWLAWLDGEIDRATALERIAAAIE